MLIDRKVLYILIYFVDYRDNYWNLSLNNLFIYKFTSIYILKDEYKAKWKYKANENFHK
jgi:hypothetical protein